MPVRIIELDTDDRRQVRQFLDLPFRLYRGTPQWVPPLAMDASRPLNRRKHPFYAHSDAAFYMAWRDGQLVGRLAVLDNRHYNDFNRERTAFFNSFECEDDAEAAGALFEAAFGWAHSRGLDKIIGPKGFTTLDGMGMLVKGFEHRPAFGIAYNLPHYPRLVEANGFEVEGELVSGYLRVASPWPERVDQLAELVKRRRGLEVVRFKSRRDILKIVPTVRDLYNASLPGTTGNSPLTEDEVKTMANQIAWFADPRLIKIVKKGDELVGFTFAYPDISAALQRTRGRVFPFGWIDLLREFKRTQWVNVNGAAIVERYRGLGGTALLFSELRKSIVECGFQHADLVQIGVENEKMQREMRDLGIEFYKVHRVYRKCQPSAPAGRITS